MKIARGGARSARGIFRGGKVLPCARCETVTLPLIRLVSGKSCILKRTQLEKTFKLYISKMGIVKIKKSNVLCNAEEYR